MSANWRRKRVQPNSLYLHHNPSYTYPPNPSHYHLSNCYRAPITAMGGLHTWVIYWGNRPRWAREDLCHSCQLVHKRRCHDVQGLNHHPQRVSPEVVHIPPPYSIDCFDTLPNLFSTQFEGSCPHQATPLSLLGVRQARDEILRDFIDRFSKAALTIKNLTQDVILQCMALTLKLGPFVDNVCL